MAQADKRGPAHRRVTGRLQRSRRLTSLSVLPDMSFLCQVIWLQLWLFLANYLVIFKISSGSTGMCVTNTIFTDFAMNFIRIQPCLVLK